MSEWKPFVKLEWSSATKKAFEDEAARFYDWSRKEDSPPVPELGLNDGWHTITPQKAEELLRRQGQNRPLSFSTIKYYAGMMVAKKWMRTGQPCIFDENGNLVDSQHRLWACYLSGAAFETYVVTEVPNIENLFAYYDNVRPRSPVDALKTAFDGYKYADVLANVVRHFALPWDLNMFVGQIRNFKVDRIPPHDFVTYVSDHLELSSATSTQMEEHRSANKLIRFKDVAAFFASKVLVLYEDGSSLIDEFMVHLGSDQTLQECNRSIPAAAFNPKSDPVLALTKKFVDNANKPRTDQLKRYQTYALLVKAFNAWRLQQPAKKWFLRDDEEWPQFANAMSAAAE